uniref:40S ribosomal protein S30 n=1 Tax=Caenorhabditis tropicalis TaxID=1561998 RepID=A0A1I7UXW5_9PELO
MQIFLLGLDNTTHTLDVDASTTLAAIKGVIGAGESFSISHGSKVLSEELTLGECQIENLSTLSINGLLLGGKVHGSLARAGKVRAQTPKVDKQDKKKKKRGRAFRRIQYTRRYVNVASGPGKKRGPNSNS